MQNSAFPNSRPWQDKNAAAIELVGDAALASEWLPWATSKLAFMLHNQPGSATTSFQPRPDVLVMVMTRPNLIRIIAGGVVKIVVWPTSQAVPNGWGEPLTTGNGIPINPPLGTDNGTHPKFALTYSKPPESKLKVEPHIQEDIGGNCFWTNGKGKTVSWVGPLSQDGPIRPTTVVQKQLSNRISFDFVGFVGHHLTPRGYRAKPYVSNFRTYPGYHRFVSNIYQDGRKLATRPNNKLVYGAGYFKGTLLCVGEISRLQDGLYSVTPDAQGVGVFTLLGTINVADDANRFFTARSRNYMFSADGSNIISLLPYADLQGEVSGVGLSFKANIWTADVDNSIAENHAIMRVSLVKNPDTGIISINSQTQQNPGLLPNNDTVRHNNNYSYTIYLAAGYKGNTETLLTATTHAIINSPNATTTMTYMLGNNVIASGTSSTVQQQITSISDVMFPYVCISGEFYAQINENYTSVSGVAAGSVKITRNITYSSSNQNSAITLYSLPETELLLPAPEVSFNVYLTTPVFECVVTGSCDDKQNGVLQLVCYASTTQTFPVYSYGNQSYFNITLYTGVVNTTYFVDLPKTNTIAGTLGTSLPTALSATQQLFSYDANPLDETYNGYIFRL